MSRYAFLAVREIDPELTPETDGFLYPLPGDRTNDIVYEPTDGAEPLRIVAKAATVYDSTGGSLRKLARVADVRIDVIVTDARVALACSKYDKGGGWVGSPGAMLMLNAASKARAAFRRRGKMLVGHARYEWLSAVGGSRKMGFRDSEMIRLMVTSEDGHGRALDITLPNNVDSLAVAREITQRVARHRLTRDLTDVDSRPQLEALMTAEVLTSTKGQFSLYRLPGSIRVIETAFEPARAAA